MIERKGGRIAVMASVKAFYVSPFNGPYSVSNDASLVYFCSSSASDRATLGHSSKICPCICSMASSLELAVWECMHSV